MRWFQPLTHEGRQTLMYRIFAGAGPALTVVVIWIMVQSLAHSLFNTFSNVAMIVAVSLLLVVTGLAMFVSIRAVKIGKGGFSAEGGNAPEAAQAVADSAQQTADVIKDGTV